MQVGHDCDLWTNLEVGDLKARELEHGQPGGRAVEQVERRHADVAGELDAAPGGTREMGDQRRRRALALRAGDADHAGAAPLGQPQRGGGRDGDAPGAKLAQLGRGGSDTPGERTTTSHAASEATTSPTDGEPAPAGRRGPGRRGASLVEGDDGDPRRRHPPIELLGERADLATGAPDADASRPQAPRIARTDGISELRARACSSLSARTASATAFAGRMPRQDLGDESLDHTVPRQRGSPASRRIAARLSSLLADALERLVGRPSPVSSAKPVVLILVVEQVTRRTPRAGAARLA